VDTRVGAPGAIEFEIARAGGLMDRALDFTRDRLCVLLDLPPAVPSARVLDGELEAHRDYAIATERSFMHARPVTTDRLPKPVGPYSPGMIFDRLIFVSGQGATDPATGHLAGADVEAQTEQCLKNVAAILEAAGSSLQHVLRCGVFLLDMREFAQMNGVYQRVFGAHRPARTTIQAAGLPGEGLRVEIDAVAYLP
jgi:2-iminobutanoate/2-iminopropanoate deaminase